MLSPIRAPPRLAGASIEATLASNVVAFTHSRAWWIATCLLSGQIFLLMKVGVPQHKRGSIYDDLPEERYHFPRFHIRQVEAAVGDFVVYYEPQAGRV